MIDIKRITVPRAGLRGLGQWAPAKSVLLLDRQWILGGPYPSALISRP